MKVMGKSFDDEEEKKGKRMREHTKRIEERNARLADVRLFHSGSWYPLPGTALEELRTIRAAFYLGVDTILGEGVTLPDWVNDTDKRSAWRNYLISLVRMAEHREWEKKEYGSREEKA